MDDVSAGSELIRERDATSRQALGVMEEQNLSHGDGILYRPARSTGFGAGEPDHLAREKKDEQHQRGRAKPRDGVPPGGQDHDDHRALQPVADEETDHLLDRGAQETQASAGRLMSWTARRDAAK